MPRTPTDSSGEPLEVLTLRVPVRHLKILDLLSLGLSARTGKRVGRGETLRHLMNPVFDALEKDTDVKQALELAKTMGVRTIPDVREVLKQRKVPERVEKWMDALDVKEA